MSTQAMCTSFKKELMLGGHQLGAITLVSRGSLTAPTKDTLKAALFTTSATLSASTTAYSSTNEASGTGYTAGGTTVTNGTDPSTSGTTAFWTPSANFQWTTVTVTTVDTVLLYNSTQNNTAISVHTFGSQSITAGTLTLTMPTNDSSNALVRIA